MKKLMIGVAVLALAAGCNKSKTEDAAVELGDSKVRAGNAALAGDALAAMSLDSSGSGIISFGEKKVKGATATFTDVSILGGSDFVSAGELVLSGLDMGDTGANFGQMSLNDIKLTAPDDEGTVNLGSIELTNPSPELAAWVADFVADGVVETDFPAVENLSFDAWSAKDLTAAFDSSDAVGTFSIDSLQISGVGELKAAGASIQGVSLDMEELNDNIPVSFSLGSFGMSNIDAGFLAAIQNNLGDEEAMMGALAAAVYDNPMDPGYDGLSLKDLSAKVAGASFELPSISSTIERNNAGQPVKYVTKPYSMKLSADESGGEFGAALLQGLSVIGFEELELKGESIAEYDPDKDIVTMAAGKNYLELVDGMKLSFGGKVEGYNAYSQDIGSQFNMSDLAAGLEPDPMAMTEALGQLTFHSLELSIEDDSMVNRVLNAVATQSGMDPETMKSQVTMGLGMAPMMAQGSGVDMGLVTELTGALSSFISDPGTLTIKLDPQAPLSVATLIETGDPSALTKDALGLSASNK